MKLCSNLTIKTPKQHHWCCFVVAFENFEHISHLLLELLFGMCPRQTSDVLLDDMELNLLKN